MRNRILHRWMNRLALAAMLALLLVPTTGRMAGMVPAPSVAMHSVAMPSDAVPTALDHTTGDHTTGVHAAAATSSHPPVSDPHGDMQDCAYCALLHSMVVLPSWLALALLPAPTVADVSFAAQTRRMQRHPTGLGSRGPPRAA